MFIYLGFCHRVTLITVKVSLNFIRLLAIISSLLYIPQAVAEALSFNITGNVYEYTVQPSDYITKIGARFGIAAKVLARENDLKFDDILQPEQTLIIDNRHIVPVAQDGDLLINLPQGMLYYFREKKLIAAYPVGLGKPSWQTPLGNFSVMNKIANKTWLVPKSIQEEMRLEGKAIETKVPPGPNNPLGKYWLGLSLSGIGIHGTIAPASVYHFQSHGCIRLHPNDIESLFSTIENGATGNIIYAPMLIAEFEGKIFLEVNQDIYNKGGVSLKALEELVSDARLGNRIDWSLANAVLKKQDGVARDVTLPPI